MKKIIFILLSVVSIVSFSQTSFQCTKTIDTSNCKLRFFNANSVKIFELNLATTTYTRGVTNEYIIKDGITQVTIPNNSCLTTPTFNSLASFIDGARIACNSNSGSSVIFPKNLDTTQVDTSLINYLVQFDTTINRLDSILASIKRQSSIDTTHTAILQSIQDSINSKLSILDKSDIDTSLVQVIQLNQIIDSLSTLINKSNIDTTHTAILNDIKELIAKLDTSSIDTSLVPTIDYSELFYALINKGYDTSQVDTALDKHILLDSTSVRIINDSIKVWFTQPLEVSKDTTHQTILSEIKELLTVINSRVDTTQQDTSLDKSIKLDSTIVRIINDTLNVRFIDSTYYTQLDSIKYYLSQNDSIELCFDTITFNSYVVNLPTTICNGDSAVRVQLCNVDSTLNEIVRTKIDSTNAILYRIENKSPFNYDTQEQFEVAGVGSTITLSPNNYHSISYTIISGVANVDIGGVLINGLPSGYTANYEATTTLTNQITITTVTSNSRVIITTIK